MIKFKDKTIMILDENGDAIPFQIETLQSDLTECFSLANQSTESHFAEDFVLALDYALHEQPSGVFFSIQELRETINNLLEEFGFFEIAEIYRNKANFIEPLYSTSFTSIKELLISKIYFPTSNLDQVAHVIAEKFALANIPEATLSLIIEFAKFVNILLAKPLTPLTPPPLKKTSTPKKYGYYIKEKELLSLFSSPISPLFDQKIFRLSPISKIHPAIKLHINLSAFATLKNLTPPLTELLILDDLTSLSSIIDNLHSTVSSHITSQNFDISSSPLPFYLYFDDIIDFVKLYFSSSSSSKSRKLAKDLADLIASPLISSVFKIFLH